MRRTLLPTICTALGGTAVLLASTTLIPQRAIATEPPAPGQMWAMDRAGKPSLMMALEKTVVNANISGFGAHVVVNQTFVNPSKSPIEALYTFPLPNDATVNRMRMKIGNRIIEGEIKLREEARRIYDQAKNSGQAAALLDQQRPNIFMQSVANIMPGTKIEVEISYVQPVKYDGGQFEFNFPMVVGPRYTTGQRTPVNSPIVNPATRTGNKIELNVRLDAGQKIQHLESILHQIDVHEESERESTIRLKQKNEIPNRDFILRYSVATGSVEGAFWSHFDPTRGGFFTLALLPPKRPTADQISNKEIIFVMDQSGSQSGFPLQKSKELATKIVKRLRPGDTFNVMGFNTSVRMLWPSPQPNTPEHIREATQFMLGMEANGGTHVREGAVAALNGPEDPNRLRIVLFNTDGYVDNEELVLKTIRECRNKARMFTFGIGNSVNRHLIDSMSEEGKGAAEYVTLAESADAAVNRFMMRLESPVLTDVHAEFDGIPVSNVLPEEIPDVFDESPIVINGRYKLPGNGRLTLTGKLGGKPWRHVYNLSFASRPVEPAVPAMWARKQVAELDRLSYANALVKPKNVQHQTAAQVALEFGIMSQYTSFVAVEPKIVNVDGAPVTVRVPIEMAQGVEIGSPLLDAGLYLAKAKSSGGGGFASFGRSVLTNGATSGGRAAASPNMPLSLSDKERVPMKLDESKIDANLKKATGKVRIRIDLSDITDATIKKLKSIGVSVGEIDNKLNIVFGSCDASKLSAIAELSSVQHIKPLE